MYPYLIFSFEKFYFYGKSCIFAPYFYKRYGFLIALFSDELPPQTRYMGKPKYIWSCAYCADFTVVYLEAVVGLSESMVSLRFLYGQKCAVTVEETNI